MAQSRTQVYLTIDTECTEERLVGGQVRPPLGYGPMIWGDFGFKRDLGIRFLARELKPYGFQATFFLEALCSTYFGTEGLREIVGYLRSEGQDVQLHIHPNFERPEWRKQGNPPPEDNIGRLPPAEQRRLLRSGFQILVACGVPQNSLLAFRAGNYGASNETCTILAELGFRLDASLNPSYVGVDCDISVENAPNDLFWHPSGIWELPVSNTLQANGALRHLEITAMSLGELKWALAALRSKGTHHISIVAHPGEFFTLDGVDSVSGRPNWINIWRLRGLLAFLQRHENAFAVSTIGKLAESLPARGNFQSRDNPYPRSGRLRYLARNVQQAVKRLDKKTGILARIDWDARLRGA